MVAPDIRSQQFQKLTKLSIRWSSLLPYCYSSATKGGNMVDKFFVTKPWQKSINKRELVTGRTILWATSSSCKCGGWEKKGGGVCARKR